MGVWDSFFVAQVGASAALAGLVFVGVSINLQKILQLPNLPGRAAQAIVVLTVVLVQSSLLLIPGESTTVTGLQILVIGAFAWALVIVAERGIWSKTRQEFRRRYLRQIVFKQLAMGFMVLAGILVLLRGDGAVYWLVPGILLSYIVALSEAWVLLIEINR